MPLDTKLVVSNRSALTKKYGIAGFARIARAVDDWIVADALRGIVSRVCWLDQPAQASGARPVPDVLDEEATKEAIDALAQANPGAAIVLLGAPDVVCHQSLTNPLWTGNVAQDPDPDVPSDLPYACDEKYGRKSARFLAPSRRVSRLPDLRGAARPTHLLRNIETAVGWGTKAASLYSRGFVLSAWEWHDATRSSTKKLFGVSKTLLSPDRGPKWSAAELGPRAHLINCHGGRVDPRFYGQAGGQYPISHHARHLKPIREGTVVAAECCYGAELYQPARGLSRGICHAYLDGGAYAYVGSTTTAYGPFEAPNSAADLVCEYFLAEIQGGATVGEAMLEARRRFVRGEGVLDRIALKTLAQFIVLGDATCRPATSPDSAKRVRRADRRGSDVERLSEPPVLEAPAASPSPRLLETMRSAAQVRTGFDTGALQSFGMSATGELRRSSVVAGSQQTRVHYLWAGDGSTNARRNGASHGADERANGPRARVVIVAREEPGKEPVIQAISSKSGL